MDDERKDAADDDRPQKSERASIIHEGCNIIMVYVTEGRMGAELRANVRIDAGELLLTEAAYCYGSHHDDDDDDDASLPSIVQAALEALQKEEMLSRGRKEAKAVEDPSRGKADAKTTTRAQTTTTRQWKDLMSSENQPTHMKKSSEDPQRQQKEALFDWGAQQTLHRLAVSSCKNKSITKQDALEAIQRVSLNAFAVKGASMMNHDVTSCWTANTITSDEDLQQAIMSIGENSCHETETMGDAVFLLASAANHSCRPNAHVTFHRQQQAPAVAASSSNNNSAILTSEDITISIRAIAPIPKHEAVTISYGPLVGVDGAVRDRRASIRASGTQSFECRCAACLEEDEEERQADGDSSGIDAAAMLFIDSYITGGQTTAEEALAASQRLLRRDGAGSSRHFSKAMSDTSLQTIPFDVGMAVEFQKLALQSLELRCHPSIAGMPATATTEHPTDDDLLAMAYELIKFSLLQLFSEEEEEIDGNTTKYKDKIIQRDVIRARRILCRYFGDANYPYRHLLDSMHC